MKTIFFIKILFIFLVLNQCSLPVGSESEIQFISVEIFNDHFSERLKMEEHSLVHGAHYYPEPSPVWRSPVNGADSLGYTEGFLWDFSDSEPHHMSVTFPGKKVGIYYWDSDSLEGKFSINRTSEIINEFLYLEGYIQVDKYGNAGNRIKGKINGRIFNTLTNDTSNVEGEFSFIRRYDFYF